MKIAEHQGSKETILFSPEITVSEEGIVTISPHTVYIRGRKFELETHTFDNPESVWFNFEGHTLEEKELRPGAFRFLSKNEDGEYETIRYVEPPGHPPVAATPTPSMSEPELGVEESPPTVEPIQEAPMVETQEAPMVKPGFLERFKKLIRRMR